MIILAIDPGLSCGWALHNSGGIISGVWNLRGNRFEGAGMRMIRLRKYLLEALEVGQPGMVAFEEVRRHMGVDAAHIYGAITHLIMEVCTEKKVPYQGVPVGTWKKALTGKGNSKKDVIIAAVRKLGHYPEDDNEADAIGISLFAREYYANRGTGLTRTTLNNGDSPNELPDLRGIQHVRNTKSGKRSNDPHAQPGPLFADKT